VVVCSDSSVAWCRIKPGGATTGGGLRLGRSEGCW